MGIGVEFEERAEGGHTALQGTRPRARPLDKQRWKHGRALLLLFLRVQHGPSLRHLLTFGMLALREVPDARHLHGVARLTKVREGSRAVRDDARAVPGLRAPRDIGEFHISDR